MTEKQIQDYIWANKENWSDLLLDFEFPELINVENPSLLRPSEVIYNKLVSEYKEIYK